MIEPEILILIPCHSLDDFPSDQTDLPAASLLNTFAVAFHPQLLAWTRDFPQWRRADDPPLARRGQLILIPTVCDDWLPHNWTNEARNAGAVVVSGLSDRQEMVAAALKVIDVNLEDFPNSELNSDDDGKSEDVFTSPTTGDAPNLPSLEEDLIADFLALGTCWLLIELLTRRMRQYGNHEETRFFQRLSAAANAAVASDGETARTHLRACFEILLEARERFYPVECYLIDLCLAVPDFDHERLLTEAQQSVPWSLLATGNDLADIFQKSPEIERVLSEACQAGRVSLVGAEDRETSLPILPLESVLYHFRRGRSELNRLVGKVPVVWGQRRFGLTALLPQLVAKFGYKAALHVVLDDGIYPDAEYTKLRWRGVDGTLIDALSRIPLAADSAASYLRFPLRLSESMDHDQVAGLILARWPSVNGPWFDDLRRSQKYAPCLGRFVTLDRFFEQTELPGQLSTYKAEEYFSPLLIQHVARRENQPISRYTNHTNRRRRFDSSIWYLATASAIRGKMHDASAWRTTEDTLTEDALEEEAPTSTENQIRPATKALDELAASAPDDLAALIMNGSTPGQGILLLNSLSFTRRAVVQLPHQFPAPPMSDVVKAVDFDTKHSDCITCVVEIPGCGYVWIPAKGTVTNPLVPKLPLAERGLLRNDLFEVALNERTGGIAHLRFHHQRNKRLSQQISFRFPRERTISMGPEKTDSFKTQYAEMRCHGHEVVHSGTARGEIASWGHIVDQTNNETLAEFRQSIQVWRGTSTVEINIELTNVKMPEGDPWNHYFASRFAWNDSSSAMTRSIYHSAHGFAGERFETSDYIEIASEDERLTIIPHGLPFHRKTGDRMFDSLLIVAGENERHFRFTVAIDAPYPLEAAWNATTPVTVIPTDQGPPSAGKTGWFFHVDARHVQITRILEAQKVAKVASPLEEHELPNIPDDPGFALRMIETEGRSNRVKLRCFGRPTFARKRDFRGETISELNIEGDAVHVDITAFEIVDIELRFGESTVA